MKWLKLKKYELVDKNTGIILVSDILIVFKVPKNRVNFIILSLCGSMSLEHKKMEYLPRLVLMVSDYTNQKTGGTPYVYYDKRVYLTFMTYWKWNLPTVMR